MKPESFHVIITRTLNKLIAEEGYTQMGIFQKFQLLEIDISRASISNLWNNKSGVSLPLLKKASEGLQLILEREFCMNFNLNKNDFEKIPNCIIRPIIINKAPINDQQNRSIQRYQIHDGRLDVPDKVAFYKATTFEIIEIGIGLRSFSSYFLSKRESAFYEPILRKVGRRCKF